MDPAPDQLSPYYKDLDNYGFKQFDYIWEPRDVVGGDFYWIAKKDNWTCIVLADCTGHGIPGAFMTMISSTILDRVSSIEDLSQPDIVLNKLDEFLENALKLNETQLDYIEDIIVDSSQALEMANIYTNILTFTPI